MKNLRYITVQYFQIAFREKLVKNGSMYSYERVAKLCHARSNCPMCVSALIAESEQFKMICFGAKIYKSSHSNIFGKLAEKLVGKHLHSFAHTERKTWE